MGHVWMPIRLYGQSSQKYTQIYEHYNRMQINHLLENSFDGMLSEPRDEFAWVMFLKSNGYAETFSQNYTTFIYII